MCENTAYLTSFRSPQKCENKLCCKNKNNNNNNNNNNKNKNKNKRKKKKQKKHKNATNICVVRVRLLQDEV